MRSTLHTLVQPLAAVALVAALLLPRPARAVDVALELSPGVAFPIGAFIDDFPVPVADVTPYLVAFGLVPAAAFAPDQPGYQPLNGALRIDLESKIGFAMGLGLMLDNWEIRYNLHVHEWGTLTLNGYNFQLGEPVAFLNNVFFDVVEPATPIVIEDAGEEADLGPLIVHRITGGYRFYVLDYWDIKPYIPIGLGLVIMHGSDFDTILGGCVELGLGIEYQFDDHWALSLAWRYEAAIMENPAIKDTGLAGQAIQAGTGGSGLFETAVEVFQSMTMAANATYRF